MTSEAFFLIGYTIDKILFYLALTFLFFYILFSRYACRVTVFNDKILFRYFFFWDKDVCILLNKVSNIDYAKSFYDIIDDKALGGLYGFPKYCYDKIIFKMASDEVEVLVNTRLYSFNKLYSIIKEKVNSEVASPS